MLPELDIKQGLAESVSSYLMHKKNILEVVLESQLATPKPKYLELYAEERVTRVYTAGGEIRTIVNSDDQTDHEALKNLNLKTFAFDDVLDSTPVHKSSDITLRDVTFVRQRPSEKNKKSDIKHACYINKNLEMTEMNSLFEIPPKELVLYSIELVSIFVEGLNQPERLEFNYQDLLRIVITRENDHFLVLCYKLKMNLSSV